MGWKLFRKPIRGVRVSGDMDMPPTTKWNFWRVMRKWRKQAVFEVDLTASREGYRVGFRTEDGVAKIKDGVFHEPYFTMRIGREPCNFFAIDRDGYEVSIRLFCEARQH